MRSIACAANKSNPSDETISVLTVRLSRLVLSIDSTNAKNESVSPVIPAIIPLTAVRQSTANQVFFLFSEGVGSALDA